MRLKFSRERDWTPYMKRALELAKEAQKLGDVPIGAVVVSEFGEILAEAHNRRELDRDPTAHAEVLALREASQKVENWRLLGATLIVTLEPCVMCSGALSLSRVDRVVYGASDLKAGGMGSAFSLHKEKALNHEMIVHRGILEEECREILVNFFKSKRKN